MIGIGIKGIPFNNIKKGPNTLSCAITLTAA